MKKWKKARERVEGASVHEPRKSADIRQRRLSAYRRSGCAKEKVQSVAYAPTWEGAEYRDGVRIDDHQERALPD